MKKWIEENKIYLSNHWLSILAKIILAFLGLFISCFGLALYQQPAVGGSQIDWTLYNIIATMTPYGSDGSMFGEKFVSIYPIALLTCNIILILFAIGFSIKPSIDDYKLTKKNKIWVLFVWMIIADLIITFSIPFIIKMFIPIVSQWVSREGKSISSSIGIRNWLFIAGFLCFVLGIGFWVKSGWMLGPFNNICTQFLRLTKLNYTIGRLIIDIFIFSLGFAFFPFIKGDSTKLNFFLTNFGLGTICFTFLVGPLVNYLILFLDKICNYEKMNNLTNKSR
ncbi:SPE_1075/MLC_0560 family membrane protein [Spiroplasma endosymbiont of Atherix ibis]|uniref:SPE_1075/MLC_0560 family membrane protein n=1 Tax=Spiroplasma endosymbiont of Atherix ibis TaxID=3066291 RepID=UPI0030D2D538